MTHGVPQAASTLDLRDYVRNVPDHPKPGIVFRDLTPLFGDAAALERSISLLAEWAGGRAVDYVVAPEARGFVLGGAVAARLKAGFIPARKPGRLPRETIGAEYTLEYGIDALEVHRDALSGGARVLVHDDLIATGGTAEALCRLVETAGAEVAGCAFVVELAFLGGRERLGGREIHSLVTYDSE
jgi:adenine phosphoribosyltransferase